MANPISTKALAIGNKLVLGAKTFRKGLVSSLDFGRNTIGRTAQKINLDQKKINREERRQASLDKQIKESTDRREKEKLIEAKKLKGSAGGLVRKTLVNPLKAFWKMVGAWAMLNLPIILDEVRKFTKKVKVIVAVIKNAVSTVGTIFKSLLSIGQAFVANLQEFDFNDSSGRIKEAKLELDENLDEMVTNFDEVKNVWGRSEEELDTILYELEEGSKLKEALRAIEQVDTKDPNPQPDSAATEPQNSAVGTNASTKSGSGKWKKILDLIAKVEAKDGSYDSIYPNSIKPGLSKMTIKEADAWQERTRRQRGSAAAGRYQFMEISRQAKQAGVGENEIFSPENQDKMAVWLIEKKRKVTMDMLENNPVESAKRLAMEWAGLPVMEATRGHKRNITRGQSYYAGDGLNKSHTKPEEVSQAFSDTLGQKDEKKPSQAPKPAPASSSSQLTNKVPFSDFSRSRAEGGGGTVGKTDGYNKNRGGGRMHKGIDIGTGGAYGWYVALKVDGTVSYRGAPDGLTRGAGKMVIIKDNKDKSREYVFMHLNKYSVSSGQKYQAGSPIGEIGNTGTSSGPHLHFEVRINNQRIDPGPYLNYIEIGRLKQKSVASSTNMSSNASDNAASTSATIASNRTGSGKVRTQTNIIKQQEIVMVT